MRRLLPPISFLLVLLPLGTASAGGPGNAPGQSASINTSPPAISGNALKGESLTASPGSWTGPNPSYSYQWNRCDSSGAACSAVPGAATPTYVLVAGDVGSTLRVAVTATNKNGSTIATSAPTSVVAAASTDSTTSSGTFSTTSATTATTTAATPATTSTATATSSTTTTTTTTTATTTTASSTAYFSDSFDSAQPFSNWTYEPTYDPILDLSIPGVTGNGFGARTLSSSYGPNSNSQMTAIYLGANKYPHAGWLDPTGRVLGQDTWYHVRLRFPSDYVPTSGDWNWLVEWHNDNLTSSYGAKSFALGLISDTSGAHLWLRPAGGSSTSPSYDSIIVPDQIQRNHWYDLTFHMIWHTSSSIGRYEFWIDGTPIASIHFPTLFTNPDGTSSYNTFDLQNYHSKATWTSEVDYDNVAIGPTRTSVGG
jgi:hypothetical protein